MNQKTTLLDRWWSFSILAAMATSFSLLGVLLTSNKTNTLEVLTMNFTPKPPIVSQSLGEKPNQEQLLVNAQTQFGFKLLSQIVQDDKNENIFVSPTSIAIALSMLYNGASGQTQQDMAKALQLQDITLETLNQGNLELQKSLQETDNKIQLNIANSLWTKQGLSFRNQFLKINRQYYDTQITNLNFASPEAVGIINRWVKDKTGGRIDKIIDRISKEDVLFLINAIYFKGTWTTEFDKKLTSNKPFYLMNGTNKPLPTMSRQGKYQYYENPEFQAVSLPYGEGRWSMYIFLPNKESNLEAFLKQLNPNTWNQWLSQFNKREGLLEIPRFKLEYEIQLKKALSALGMGSAFNPSQADFSQMTSNPVVVSEVKHKTFVEVNEEGTEAAAVTSIGIRATSIMPDDEPFKMIVNRPFFCAIRDNQTGTILFMGTIFEPK